MKQRIVQVCIKMTEHWIGCEDKKPNNQEIMKSLRQELLDQDTEEKL
jgi:hypothetical protein